MQVAEALSNVPGIKGEAISSIIALADSQNPDDKLMFNQIVSRLDLPVDVRRMGDDYAVSKRFEDVLGDNSSVGVSAFLPDEGDDQYSLSAEKRFPNFLGGEARVGGNISTGGDPEIRASFMRRFAGGGDVDIFDEQNIPADMYRRDGSLKSQTGFLGPIINKHSGKPMTELSIGVEIGGREVEIPSMVPTLTEEERILLQNLRIGVDPVPKSIAIKAKRHALERIKAGLNPFLPAEPQNMNLGGSVGQMNRRQQPKDVSRLTPAQLANIGAAFADPLGMIDITGEYPEFPAAGVSTAEMVMQGPRSPSFMENLREGDYGAAALQGVGVIPVAGGAARAIRGMLKGTDRLEKAKKAGFDTDTVYYHGADADITEFRMPSRETGQTKTVGTGVFMSSSPEVASSYAKSLDDAAVYPVYINKQEFLKVRPAEKGNFWSRIPTDGLVVEFPDGTTKPATDVFKLEPGETDTDELSRIARSQGHKGLIVEGVVDAGVGGAGEYRYATQYLRDKGYDVSLPIGTTKESFDKMNAVPPEIMKEARLYAKAQLYRPADVVVSFDPKNIRSVNAEFEDLDSPELLKAKGGAIDINDIDIFAR